MRPVIPLLALLGIVGSVGTLCWYGCLSETQKEEADRIAGEYASLMFGKALDELTSSEAAQVRSLTLRHAG